MDTPQYPKDLSDEKQAATHLGVSVEFLQKDRCGPKQIPFVKIGRRVLYDPADLRAFIERCKVRAAA